MYLHVIVYAGVLMLEYYFRVYIKKYFDFHSQTIPL